MSWTISGRCITHISNFFHVENDVGLMIDRLRRATHVLHRYHVNKEFRRPRKTVTCDVVYRSCPVTPIGLLVSCHVLGASLLLLSTTTDATATPSSVRRPRTVLFTKPRQLPNWFIIAYIQHTVCTSWRCVYSHIWLCVFGRPFVKRFVLCYQTVVCLVCPVCNVGILWPNGSMDQDETWRACRPLPWPHCVRWGPSAHFPKGAHPPIIDPAKCMDEPRCHLVRR